MKETGIVRRIDVLGRIVIPKEIRQTMRLCEGDPLEIYIESDGKIVLQKYSSEGNIISFANQYADILTKIAGLPTIVCDKKQVIAVAGMSKHEVLKRPVSEQLENAMKNRKTVIAGKDNIIYPIEGLDKPGLVCTPIVSSGNLGGAIIFMDNGTTNTNDTHIKLTQSAAMFLGRQMEN